MSSPTSPQIAAAAAKVRLCLFDVDGVLTDGKIILGPDQQEYKAFDVKDGQGLVMLREFIEVGIITGRQSSVVADRMAQLGIEHVYQGQKNKLVAFESLLGKLGLSADAVCYVGDDLPDLSVMTRVGLPVAVADAVPAVKKIATWCTAKAGGRGAAREVCEMLLSAQGYLPALLDKAAGGTVQLDSNR